MKILYGTDFHGDLGKYYGIAKIAIDENIPFLILGADILPKLGERREKQKTFIERKLKNFFNYLKRHEITCLLMMGNDDMTIYDEDFDELCSKYENIVNIDKEKFDFNGYEFIGLNNILDHPFGCKDRILNEIGFKQKFQYFEYPIISKEDGYDYILDWYGYLDNELPTMKEMLDSLPDPKNMDKTIYIFHMTPANTGLGKILRGDEDVGSHDISNFILEKQPLLTLHGHIHEAPRVRDGKWRNEIGKTICINPGQTEFNNRRFNYSIIDLDTMNIELLEAKSIRSKNVD